MDGAVGFDLVHRTQTVLDDEERLLVAVVQGVQGHAQADRVDLPAPLACGEVRVLERHDGGVARLLVLLDGLGVCRGASRRIIAEADEINSTGLDLREVVLGAVELDACTLHPLPCPDGIGTTCLCVDEEVVVAVSLHCGVNVVGVAGEGVILTGSQHTADHRAGHQLVSQLDGLCAGDQLIVSGTVLDLFGILAFLEQDACAHERHVEQHVDLVEGQPVLDFAGVTGEDGGAVFQVGIDHAAVFPAAVLLDEGDGGIKVADGDERLDAVLQALVDHLLIELQALFVGGVVVAVGQDTGPCDREAIALEAHLREQLDVLFEVVVHVDGLMCWVLVLVVTLQHLYKAAADRHTVLAKGDDINGGQALAALLPAALALVRGGCTAP